MSSSEASGLLPIFDCLIDRRPAHRSRLIVKNLPAYLSDTRLREHFSQKGLVTDVKLMTRPDGTSRRFGFVGYRDAEQAQQALDYFNKTFIDTSRIQVEFAKVIGDDELAARKQNRLAVAAAKDQGQLLHRPEASTSSQQQPPPTKKRKEKASGSAKGVSFEEFMAVMAPSKKRKTWQNEEDAPEVNLKSSEPEQALRESKREEKKAKRKEQKQQVEQDQETSAASPPDAEYRAVTPDEALNDEGLTDMEYMARRMRRGVGKEGGTSANDVTRDKEFEQSDSEAGSDDESSDGEDDGAPNPLDEERAERERKELEEKARKDQEAVDTIMASARLFVRNLPFAVTEEELAVHFAQFGPLKQVSTMKEPSRHAQT